MGTLFKWMNTLQVVESVRRPHHDSYKAETVWNCTVHIVIQPEHFSGRGPYGFQVKLERTIKCNILDI